MDLGIRGKRALVCASSKGLGRGCAEALAEAGAALVMNARSEGPLNDAAEAIRQAHGVGVTAVAFGAGSPRETEVTERADGLSMAVQVEQTEADSVLDPGKRV